MANFYFTLYLDSEWRYSLPAGGVRGESGSAASLPKGLDGCIWNQLIHVSHHHSHKCQSTNHISLCLISGLHVFSIISRFAVDYSQESWPSLLLEGNCLNAFSWGNLQMTRFCTIYFYETGYSLTLFLKKLQTTGSVAITVHAAKQTLICTPDRSSLCCALTKGEKSVLQMWSQPWSNITNVMFKI